MKRTVHLCPSNSLFSSKVEALARARSEEVCLYEASYTAFSVKDWQVHYKIARSFQGCKLVFHYVPTFALALIKLSLRQLDYELFYWGDDYYLWLLAPNRLERHCLDKSPFSELIRAGEIEFSTRSTNKLRLTKRFEAFLRLRLALYVASHATCIYASPKQYRYIRYINFLLTGRSNFCQKNELLTAYAELDAAVPNSFDPGAPLGQLIFRKPLLNVLVCHSATPSVNVSHSLTLVAEMARRRSCAIHVRGFLSYSGGTDAERDTLEKKYINQALSFTRLVTFERRFFTSSELWEKLGLIDLAFFSCYRDEGLTLLNMLAQRGVPLAFNRFSINYDHFKARGYKALLSHEDAIGIS